MVGSRRWRIPWIVEIQDHRDVKPRAPQSSEIEKGKLRARNINQVKSSLGQEAGTLAMQRTQRTPAQRTGSRQAEKTGPFRLHSMHGLISLEEITPRLEMFSALEFIPGDEQLDIPTHAGQLRREETRPVHVRRHIGQIHTANDQYSMHG